jgi:hypothetical protein
VTRLLATSLIVLAACQDNVATPFPPGLEPLDDNQVPDSSEVTEVLRHETVSSGPINVHGRGYVLVAPGTLWALTKQPEAMIARCSTTEQRVTVDTDGAYEFSFLVHYIVRDILTVEWDDQWRYGVIEGTVDDPELGMIRHQKTQGSDFIDVSEGTIQVLATDDPDVSELAFVEHLEAVSGGADDVLAGMQNNYDALVALAHGAAIPACR